MESPLSKLVIEVITEKHGKYDLSKEQIEKIRLQDLFLNFIIEGETPHLY